MSAPWLERYRALLRAKRAGRWRWPLPVCILVYLLLSPLILVIIGMVCVAGLGIWAWTDIPLLGMLFMLFVTLILCRVLADVLYILMRTSGACRDWPYCRGCGYNLTGNVSGVCTECGRSVGARDN